MKKLLSVICILCLSLAFVGTVYAEIIPPHGEGQIGLQSVVLCEKLTVREEADASSAVVETLEYGALPIVTQQSDDGWAFVVLGDSEESPAGWVKADYIVIDPAWYVTEGSTPVYAWNDETALKVGLLDKDERLPILKEEEDWLLISLRGAVGWIHK